MIPLSIPGGRSLLEVLIIATKIWDQPYKFVLSQEKMEGHRYDTALNSWRSLLEVLIIATKIWDQPYNPPFNLGG